MILETGETKWLGLGVVFEDYGTTLMPGWRDGTVGYHTNNRNIFDDEHKETTGSVSKGLTVKHLEPCPPV